MRQIEFSYCKNYALLMCTFSYFFYIKVFSKNNGDMDTTKRNLWDFNGIGLCFNFNSHLYPSKNPTDHCGCYQKGDNKHGIKKERECSNPYIFA